LPPLTRPNFERLGETVLHFRIGSRNVRVRIGHRSFLNPQVPQFLSILSSLGLLGQHCDRGSRSPLYGVFDRRALSISCWRRMKR
jgi:hypothetical protein